MVPGDVKPIDDEKQIIRLDGARHASRRLFIAAATAPRHNIVTARSLRVRALAADSWIARFRHRDSRDSRGDRRLDERCPAPGHSSGRPQVNIGGGYLSAGYS